MKPDPFSTSDGCNNEIKIFWRFRLSEPAPCNGYFVQDIYYSCLYQRCSEGKCPVHDNTQEGVKRYWEAWFVARDQPTSLDDQPKFTDGSQIVPSDEHCGRSNLGHCQIFVGRLQSSVAVGIRNPALDNKRAV
jgi:hypothetical protein